MGIDTKCTSIILSRSHIDFQESKLFSTSFSIFHFYNLNAFFIYSWVNKNLTAAADKLPSNEPWLQLNSSTSTAVSASSLFQFLVE